MRILSLIVLMACGPAEQPGSAADADTGWAPEEPWSEAAVDGPAVVMDALNAPGPLALGGGSLWVAEADALWRHDGQTAELWAEDLSDLTHLAADGVGPVVIAGGAVHILDGVDAHTIATGLVDPQGIALGLESIWWLDGGTGADGTLMRAGRDGANVQTIASGLESPQSLSVLGERAVLAEAGNWRVIQLSATADLRELLTIGGTVRDIATDCQDVFLAVESTRWPYPGVIAAVDGDEATRLGESPPEPDRLRIAGDVLVWSTKQSIHRMDRTGGSFTTLASRTAVGDLVVWGDQVIWTNPERREVLATGL